MSREEAINNLNMISVAFVEAETKEQRKIIDDTFNMAIKALEQEPILDKIRAEIERLTITEGGEDYTRKMAELYSLKIKVLQIIDKYRGG